MSSVEKQAEEKMEVDKPETGRTRSAQRRGESGESSSSSGEEGSQVDTVKDVQAKYNLRTSSLINRIQTERKRAEPKEPKPKTKPPPLSKYRRKTANARERSRMKEINQAYEDLRQVVPQLPHEDNKNTTKITTLRLALNYIAALRDILGYEDLYESESSYLSRSPSTSGASECSSPSSSHSQSVSPTYPTGEFSDGPITPGQLDSEGESLVSS